MGDYDRALHWLDACQPIAKLENEEAISILQGDIYHHTDAIRSALELARKVQSGEMICGHCFKNLAGERE